MTTAYAGELGYELMLFLPLVHAWHSWGVPIRTLGPPGSAAFYPFSPNHTEARAPTAGSRASLDRLLLLVRSSTRPVQRADHRRHQRAAG